MHIPHPDLHPHNEEPLCPPQPGLRTDQVALYVNANEQNFRAIGTSRSEEIQRAAELLDEGFWSVNQTDGSVFVSDSWKKTVGIPGDLTINTQEALLEVVHPAERTRFRSVLESRTGAKFQFPVRLRGQIGPYGMYFVKGWYGDDGGQLLGTMLRIEGTELGPDDGLRLLSEAVEVGFEAMLVLREERNDLNQIVDFQVVGLNAKGAGLLGAEREAAIGKMLGDLAPAAREEGLIGRFASTIEKGLPDEHDFYAAPGGLKQIWMRQRIVPLHDGVVLFVSDVSEAKRTTSSRSNRRVF